MADNTTLSAGAGGDVIASDDVTTLNGGASSGVKVQRVKIGSGADGTFNDATTSNPIPVRVGDGTNQVTLKAASTAAVAGDTAQVVALHPSTPLPAGTNSIGSVNLVSSQGSAAAVAQAISAAIADNPGVATTTSGTGQAIAAVGSAGNATFHIVTSAFVGTLVFEASLNGGTNYASVMCIREDGTGSETSTAINTASAFIRAYTVGLPGFTHFRVRCSAFTSGTAAIYITQGPFLIETNPSLSASTASIGVVTQQAITKGTQGTTGVTTQDLKDAGRVSFGVATVIAGVTAVTTEALLSMVPVRDGTAGGAATTFAVTSGKRLRLTSITVGLISTSAAVLSGRFVLRMNPSGAAAATSPIYLIVPVPSGAALAQAGGALTITIPDGLELSGTQQFGVSQVCSATTGTVWCSVQGFEY
jgi:hypothetical protein